MQEQSCLKFWMQIDKDEQARRFKARQENPKKQWKITDEDWRNREKWDQYEVAVEEMLEKTSMPHAPWIVVEGNDKYYARIKGSGMRDRSNRETTERREKIKNDESGNSVEEREKEYLSPYATLA